MNDKLRLLWVGTTNSGVMWWRGISFWEAAHRTGAMEMFCPFWNKDQPLAAPWETEICDPERPYLRQQIINYLDACARGTKDGKPADAIVMQMAHYDASLQVFAGLKAYGVPVIAEIDDNYLATPEYNPAFMPYAPGGDFRRIANSQFEFADALIVSTPELKGVYSHLNEHSYVIPNSIDFKLWNKARGTNKPGVRIGWAGGASHDKDLKIIEPVIHKILEQHKDVTFVIIHGVPQFLKNIPRVENVMKFERIDKYPQFLAKQDIDIWLAPLVDNAFNRSKSNLRWLEAAALGAPCVASNVGHFKETINHGVDGFLCNSADDFERHLTTLITDRKARISMGLKAKDRAFQDFNVEKTVFTYVEALKDIISRGQFRKDEDRIIYGQKKWADVEAGALIQ